MKIVRKKDKIVIESILDENDYNSFLEDYNHVLNESEKGNNIPALFVLQMLNKLGTKSTFHKSNIEIETITDRVCEKLKVYDFNIPIENTHIVLSLEEMIRIGVSTAVQNREHVNDPTVRLDIITYYTVKALAKYSVPVMKIDSKTTSYYKMCVITGFILVEMGYRVTNAAKPTKKDYYKQIQRTVRKMAIKEKGED